MRFSRATISSDDEKRSAFFSSGTRELHATNFASRFGRGLIPKFLVGSLFSFWSTMSEMKNLSLLI